MEEFKVVNTEEFSGVKIIKINPVNPNDSRGPTYEIGKTRASAQVTVYIRHKGTIFGNHYHTGDDVSKKPERHFLAEGKVILRSWNPQKQKLELVVESGTEVTIESMVLHSFEALTDVVVVEPRPTIFFPQRPDTYNIEPDKYLQHIQKYINKK